MRTLALAALLLAACPAPQSAVPQCSHDEDCPFGTVCISSQCVEGCVENGDCGLAHPCIEGRCETSAGACNADFFCAFGELCDLDRQRCVSHRASDVLCRACHVRYCFGPEDCPVGVRCDQPEAGELGQCRMCDDGSCRQFAAGGSCSRDSDCGEPGAFCYKQPCSDDEGCAAGSKCSHAFAPNGTRPAENYGACDLGQCIRAFCSAPGCDRETDLCPRGFSCFTLLGGQSCDDDGDCPLGRSCVPFNNEALEGGVCGCSSDAQCSEGERCDNGVCFAGTACEPTTGLTCEEMRP